MQTTTMYIWEIFPTRVKRSPVFCFRHQAMETGDHGAPGASVLAHVGEEYSLPTAIAITLHLETVAATAQERGPYTAPAVLHPVHLMVGCSWMSVTTCVMYSSYFSRNKQGRPEKYY